MMLAPTMLAPQWYYPALSLSIEHGVHSRHGRLALLDDLGHHRKHRATVLCAAFEDVAECKQLVLLSAFPEGDADVPRNTPCRTWSSGVVVRPHHRSLMD